MKSAIALLTAALMVLGCSAFAAAEGVSGTATASAQGQEETVTVTMTMEDGKITAVEAATDKEDSEIGDMCIARIPPAMVEGNTVAVDAISGATSTSNAIIAAATNAYMELIGEKENINLDAWAKGSGYVKAEDFAMAIGVDAVTSATESGVGGINFGDVELSDELKKEMIVEYLKGADGNCREMFQIATSYNNVPTVGSVEYVLDPEDMTLMGASEANTTKLNNMMSNPSVDLYWTHQIRQGDVISEEMPVTPSYFMSYGVEIKGTVKIIDWANLDDTDKGIYLAKARHYFETMGAQYASITGMEDEQLFSFLSASAATYYQIVPTRIVVTSPWFLSVYDTGYARQFISEELTEKLAAAVSEVYPEASALTTLDYATMTATGLKTQQVLVIKR